MLQKLLKVAVIQAFQVNAMAQLGLPATVMSYVTNLMTVVLT